MRPSPALPSPPLPSPPHRYTVQELLVHAFFQVSDYKIEVLPPDDPMDKGSNIISLRIEPQRLKLPDVAEEAATAFDVTYDLQSDVPDNIASDLVLQGIISREDIAEVSKLIEKKVAQKREQENEPVVVTQQPAVEERGGVAESTNVSPHHVARQESVAAVTTQPQQESPLVKMDDTAASGGEESHLRSPQPDDPPAGVSDSKPTSGDSLDPTPSTSTSSSPDNPPPTAVESQQGPAPQPPPTITSQLSEIPEELPLTRSTAKLPKVASQPQDEVGGGGEKQKKQRPRAASRVSKEGKRPLKLLLSGVQAGNLAECQFTSFGQQIKFTFSLEADTPDLLAENLVSSCDV